MHCALAQEGWFEFFHFLNEETLVLDLIKKVGIGRDYLAEKHANKNVRRDLWYPPTTDRASYETWVVRGAKDFRT